MTFTFVIMLRENAECVYWKMKVADLYYKRTGKYTLNVNMIIYITCCTVITHPTCLTCTEAICVPACFTVWRTRQ